VNPSNGDVAVFNIFGLTGYGGIYVFSCPSCTPALLTIPQFYYYYFGAYDTKGDVFVDGKASSNGATLGEVPAGQTTGKEITVSGSGGTIYFPGLVQWYKPGKYLVVGDQLCDDQNASCLYWVKISGSKGTIIGKTTLLGFSGEQICDLVQGVLNPVGQKNVLGSNYNYCGSGPSTLNRWLYPAGGEPTNSVDYSSLYSVPSGAAVSVK
jgi:hypothetical protein